MRTICICFLILLLPCSPRLAYSLEERDTQAWLNLTTVGTFKNQGTTTNFKYWLEGQARFGDDISSFSQGLARTGLGYALTKNFSVWLGYAWIRTDEPFAASPFNEERIWQQLLWVKTYPHYTFTARTRFEQRFQQNTQHVSHRLRQMLKVSLPFSNSKWSVVSSDEVFWRDFTDTNHHFDQNRYFVGLGYKINSKLTTEVGYMNQFIERNSGINFLANIASINFYLNL